MTLEFLHRIRREITVTLTGIHEAVIAVSERVNRKVQILKLHWQASSLSDQLETLYSSVGQSLSEVPSGGWALPGQPETEARLAEAAARVRVMKHELSLVEARIRELETEALREDLLKLQHDLFIQSAAIQPVVVAAGSAAIGQSAGQVVLPATIRIAGVVRGHSLLVALDSVWLGAGDIVVLLGPRADLNRIVSYFVEKQRAFV
jgi:hypothetical protein